MLLTIFAKRSIFDVWQDSKCVSVYLHWKENARKYHSAFFKNFSSYTKGGHSFLSTYAIFSEKLTFLITWYAHVRTWAYQGVRNVSFSNNFAYVLNEWPLVNVNINCLIFLNRWYLSFTKTNFISGAKYCSLGGLVFTFYLINS